MHSGFKKNIANIIKAGNNFAHLFRQNTSDKSDYQPLPADIIRSFNKTRILGPQRYLCYAPFKMIYFAFNGEVIACCHNRKHILGKYPEQRIDEIWGGKEFNKLRNYIHNDDLSYGCDVCKYALLSENFDGAKNGLYDRYRVKKYPQIMEFELDNRCNLSCVICNDIFSSSIEKEKQGRISESPYDENFVKQIIPYMARLKQAKFYGGEPFLINVYYDLWEKMLEINPNIEIVVQTNGTVLNERIKKLLERGHFHINISIDSLNKERFEKIRKNAVFEQTMHNVAWFLEYSERHHTHMGIIPTPNRLNWPDLPELVNWASSMGAKVYFNTLITPLDLALWNLPSPELRTIHNELLSRSVNTSNSIAKENARHYNDFLKQLQAWGAKNKEVSSNKIKISSNQLNEIRDQFLINLQNALKTQNQSDLFSLFEQLYLSLDGYEDKEFFFAAINTVPMEKVIEELATRDIEHLTKLMGKKIYEGSSDFELI